MESTSRTIQQRQPSHTPADTQCRCGTEQLSCSAEESLQAEHTAVTAGVKYWLLKSASKPLAALSRCCFDSMPAHRSCLRGLLSPDSRESYSTTSSASQVTHLCSRCCFKCVGTLVLLPCCICSQPQLLQAFRKALQQQAEAGGVPRLQWQLQACELRHAGHTLLQAVLQGRPQAAGHVWLHLTRLVQHKRAQRSHRCKHSKACRVWREWSCGLTPLMTLHTQQHAQLKVCQLPSHPVQ